MAYSCAYDHACEGLLPKGSEGHQCKQIENKVSPGYILSHSRQVTDPTSNIQTRYTKTLVE